MALSWFTDKKTNITTVTTNLGTYMESYSQKEVVRQIIDILAKEWVEKYGADLIDDIAPEDVKKAISQTIAERMFNNG